jgi:hypothetical protein
MITIKEKINNLEVILKQQELALETKQLLLKEIKRLQELSKENKQNLQCPKNSKPNSTTP